MLRRFLALMAIALVTVLGSAPAHAAPNKKDVVMAKKAATEAKRAEKKKDWEDAREAWQKSVDLHDTPGARIGLAGAEAKLGRLLLAREHLEKALEMKKLSWAAKRKAKKQLKELDEKIPTLTVEPPADFSGKLFVDDEEKESSALAEPLQLDPGEHTVRAEAEGFKPFSESIVLEEGDKKNLTILLTELPKTEAAPVPEEKEPEKSSSAQSTIGWVAIAVGGAGLVFGTVMGLQAQSKRNELGDKCADDRCTEAERDLFDQGKQQANLATAGFIVGGVGIGLGTFLLLTAGGDEKPEPAADEARIEPVLGLGYVGAQGSF